MKIGIDMDDVIADTIDEFIKFFNDKYYKNIQLSEWKNYHTWDCDFFKGDKSEGIALFDEFFCLKAQKIKPIKDSREILSELGKNNELFIITSRDIRFKNETEKFLTQNFPSINFKIIFSGEIYGGKSKSQIARELNLDFMIDDNLDYAEACVQEGIRVLLFDKPWNQGDSGKVERVYDWKEILEKINGLEIKNGIY